MCPTHERAEGRKARRCSPGCIHGATTGENIVCALHALCRAWYIGPVRNAIGAYQFLFLFARGIFHRRSHRAFVSPRENARLLLFRRSDSHYTLYHAPFDTARTYNVRCFQSNKRRRISNIEY